MASTPSLEDSKRQDATIMTPRNALVWVNKTAQSSSLSHSEGKERIQIFSHTQKITRPRRKLLHRDRAGAAPSQRLDSKRTFNSDGNLGGTAMHLDPSIVSPAVSVHDPSWTTKEHRALIFFLQKTVHEIIPLQHDLNFWTRIVPYMAVDNAAVRHLVAAIASTHEILFDGDAESADMFAMQQCNKATTLMRASPNLPLPLLLVSCILIAAYSLLRGNIAQADVAVEDGLKLARATEPSPVAYNGLPFMLSQLRYRHTYKLWSVDVAFRFEKIDISEEPMNVEMDWVEGPLSTTDQVIHAYKALMVDIMPQVVRNVARGAYIDPECLLVKSMAKQLKQLSTSAKTIYEQLSPGQEDQRIALKQLRMGINHAILLFHTKLTSPVELAFDAWYNTCQESLTLAKELFIDRLNGHSLAYVDRVVNLVLFAIGLSSRSTTIQRQAISLLQQQALEEDELAYWLHGAVLETVNAVEREMLSTGTLPLTPTLEPVCMTLVDVSYNHLAQTMRVEYTVSNHDEVVHFSHRPVDWSTWPRQTPQASEIDSALNGIIASDRMYSKARPSEAPRGCVREMVHRGSLVPGLWEAAASRNFKQHR